MEKRLLITIAVLVGMVIAPYFAGLIVTTKPYSIFIIWCYGFLAIETLTIISIFLWLISVNAIKDLINWIKKG